MKTNPYLPTACTLGAKACILLAAASALWPASVQADCPQGWDVSNAWQIRQGRTDVYVDVRQSGTAITGTAKYFGQTKKAGKGPFASYGEDGWISGTLDGTVVGTQFKMHIYWPNNSTIGVYDGTIRPTGKIEGTIYDQAKPASKQVFYSVTTMPCKPAPNMPQVDPNTKPRPNPSAAPRLLKPNR